MPQVKPYRRVVTGHDASGNAVFRSDDMFTPEMIPSGDAAMSTIWTTATVPADNNDETDGRSRDAGVTLSGGSVIRIVDMMPGEQSPMHRTNSIDYGIVMDGAIELELDNGEKTVVEAGGVIIQRGTIHLWRNPSADTVCRIVFILIEAPPYLHQGKPLAQARPEDMDH